MEIGTVLLIVLLERTRLGPLGLVLDVVVTSAVTVGIGWHGVATGGDLGAVPRSLPMPQMPLLLGLVPSLLVPALSLAIVGLVQGPPSRPASRIPTVATP